MVLPSTIAALVALPVIAAQSNSTGKSTVTTCLTRLGFYPLPTGTNSGAVPTWYTPIATTNTIQVSVITQSTVTVIPNATTFTNVVTVSTVTTTTSTSTPPPSTVATPSGFAPMLLANLTSATGMPVLSRLKKFEIEGRSDSISHSLKHRAPPGNTNGFMAYPNGTYSGLYRRYPHRVDCDVIVTYEQKITTTEEGDPVTSIAQQQTVSDMSTFTRTETSTVTAVVPAETIYAACGANNVVNQVQGVNGSTLYFKRIIYHPLEGFPDTNELIMKMEDPVSCCVQCQKTPFCAGSFYAPGYKTCHLRLTQPYTQPNVSPSVLPFSLPSGIFAGNWTNFTLATGTGTAPPYAISTGAPSNNTCSAGSLSLFLGAISGQKTFPGKFALYASNGPCGRFGVSVAPLKPAPVASNCSSDLASFPTAFL